MNNTADEVFLAMKKTQNWDISLKGGHEKVMQIIEDQKREAVEAYKKDMLSRAQLESENDPGFPARLFVMEVYRAFGWQGGTIHQIMAEIKRLRELEPVK